MKKILKKINNRHIQRSVKTQRTLKGVKMDLVMEKEFHELKNKVDDIHRFLFGLEHEEDVGILYRIRKNEADIQNFKDWKARITYFAYGMIVPASYGVFDVIKSILQVVGK